MSVPVLIDTSVWIELFNRPTTPIADHVRDLIRQDRARLTGVVLAEILRGIKGARERSTVDSTLEVISFLGGDRSVWEFTGNLLCELARGGLTVTVADGYIAAVCLQHQAALYTLDQIFHRIPNLRLFVPDSTL